MKNEERTNKDYSFGIRSILERRGKKHGKKKILGLNLELRKKN
jgi:hypothetical protein